MVYTSNPARGVEKQPKTNSERYDEGCDFGEASPDRAAGDAVAIFGVGAVGLLTAYAARLRGASNVYVIDAIPERL
jgi:glutathione-independent formaldehyde dehydrogenase